MTGERGGDNENLFNANKDGHFRCLMKKDISEFRICIGVQRSDIPGYIVEYSSIEFEHLLISLEHQL